MISLYIWDFKSSYHQNYKDALDFLEDSVVKTNGYVIAIMNERILSPSSSSRYELTKAIRDNRSLGKSAPNIIPFVSQEPLIDLIVKDEVLSSLSMCDIQKLNGTDNEQKSDEFLKRVLTQLMTPGSIRVLAETFSRNRNAIEAGFLKGLLENAKGTGH